MCRDVRILAIITNVSKRFVHGPRRDGIPRALHHVRICHVNVIGGDAVWYILDSTLQRRSIPIGRDDICTISGKPARGLQTDAGCCGLPRIP